MANTFMNNLIDANNYEYTANGALAHVTTKNKVYDMFALGGAYRNRGEKDCILLFKKAFEEDPSMALKCLFYLRDFREGSGQGERRFFRVCFRWLANEYPEIAKRLLLQIPVYGRWDDLIMTTIDTPLQENMLEIIETVLYNDLNTNKPSLLAKWMPSINASSVESRKIANVIRKYLKMDYKEYRKTLSTLREKIKVLERLMSLGRWDEIEFDKIPSKAGLIYKNAFAKHDIIKDKYEKFIKSKDTKANAETLYPYEIVRKTIKCFFDNNFNEIDRIAVEKYWNNLPDYFNGKPCNIMCVVDTSGSMTWNNDYNNNNVIPIDVAISLGIYCAERNRGPFKNSYISFSQKPTLINIEGVDFVDKVERIYKQNLCENTNLTKTFEMLLECALNSKKEDIPETIVVISDMQIDEGDYRYTRFRAKTEMEKVREEWESNGLEMPKLVYWNVNASNKANFLEDNGPNITYVSGCSPTIFRSVITGKTGWDLCLEILNSERYEPIH